MISNDFNEREEFLARAETCLKDEVYQIAVDLAGERLQRFPGDIDARVILCRALLGKGELEKAELILDDMKGIMSGMALVYARMGDLYRERGREEAAVLHYRKFIALDPGSDYAKNLSRQLGAGLYPSGGSFGGDEEDSYDDVRDLATDFHTLTLVELYIRQGHLGMAADVLEEIVRRDGTNAKAAELLRCVRAKRYGASPARRAGEIISELTRWMKNIDRMHVHAG